MKDSDERIRKALQEGFGGDDPGERFDNEVMERAIERGGGESEISVLDDEPARRGRWWMLLPAAAAAMLAFVLLGGIPDGNGDGPEGGAETAGPGETEDGILLPEAANPADGMKCDVKVVIDRKGEITVGGKPLDIKGLQAFLRNRAAVHRSSHPDSVAPDGASPLAVRVWADRRMGWRSFQWFLQACASVGIYRISWQVRNVDDGELAAFDLFLPRDRGLERVVPKEEIDEEDPERGPFDGEDGRPPAGGRGGRGPEGDPPDLLEEEIKPDIVEQKPIEQEARLGPGGTTHFTLELMRTRDELATRVRFLGKVLGAGGTGFEALGKALSRLAKLDREFTINLKAWRDVPYGDVVRAVDLLIGAGITEITFTGAPPRFTGLPPKPEPELGLADRVYVWVTWNGTKTDLRAAHVRTPRAEVRLIEGDPGPRIRELRKLHPDASWWINPAGNVPHKAIVKVIDALMTEGIRDISMVGVNGRTDPRGLAYEEDVGRGEVLNDALKDRPFVGGREEIAVSLEINDGRARLRIGGEPWDDLEAGLLRLKERVLAMKRRGVSQSARIVAGKDVRFGDVARVQDLLTSLGVTKAKLVSK